MLAVDLALTRDETVVLLNLLGHSGEAATEIEVVNLVKALYRTLYVFEHEPATGLLSISMEADTLYHVHRVFSPQAFGTGGRAFQAKLSDAFVRLDRLEDIPEIEAIEPDGTDLDLPRGFNEEETRELLHLLEGKEVEKDNG